MPNITVPLDESFKRRLESFPWVNWSEVGREEILKRDIFDRYARTRVLSCKDEEFCENIDWHPVDELPLREEFVEKLKAAEKGGHREMTAEEFSKWCDEL